MIKDKVCFDITNYHIVVKLQCFIVVSLNLLVFMRNELLRRLFKWVCSIDINLLSNFGQDLNLFFVMKSLSYPVFIHFLNSS